MPDATTNKNGCYVCDNFDPLVIYEDSYEDGILTSRFADFAPDWHAVCTPKIQYTYRKNKNGKYTLRYKSSYNVNGFNLLDGMQYEYDGNGDLMLKRFYIVGRHIEAIWMSSSIQFEDSHKESYWPLWQKYRIMEHTDTGMTYLKQRDTWLGRPLLGVKEKINEYDIETLIRVFLDDIRYYSFYHKRLGATRFISPEDIVWNDFNINAVFEELENDVIAASYGINDDRNIILKIDSDNWMKATTPEKWYILYHELGHDILNFKHGQGGRMMFPKLSLPSEFSWDQFIEDREYMFNSYWSKQMEEILKKFNMNFEELIKYDYSRSIDN